MNSGAHENSGLNAVDAVSREFSGGACYIHASNRGSYADAGLFSSCRAL